MTSAHAALERLCDPVSEVSSHYLIDEKGKIFSLVDEKYRAWHAGAGSWRGESDINSTSIGIEIVNPGHEFGYVPFPDVQMQSVFELSRQIVKRHDITACNVVGHSDIAPKRKQDPGELFDWQRLSTYDVGMWVEPNKSYRGHKNDLPKLLTEIGYDLEGDATLTNVVEAFQRHWRQSLVTGRVDQETADLIFTLHHEVKRLT